MASPVLWVQADLEAELGAEVVIQILDDDNDGVADPAAILRLQESSAAYVTSSIERIYPTLVDLIASWQSDLTKVPPKLKSLALDHAVATLAKRNGTYVRRDWLALMKYIDAQLERIRKTGLDSLGIRTEPEPAANQGGSLEAVGGLVGESPVLVFNGSSGLGDF